MRKMKKIITSFALFGMSNFNVYAQELDFLKVKAAEKQLEDVMEMIDTLELKSKLKEVEADFARNSSEINKVRLGLIYHETALNLSFFSKTSFKGYAKKSYEILDELYKLPQTSPELKPFIASYRASAMSLVGAEIRKLNLLDEAFVLFEEAINLYNELSYLPEFLRGSVAENLPWYFVRKRKIAKHDFESIINKQKLNPEYANWKIMSFTYWAWANQHQRRKYKSQSLNYLNKAIELDPNYRGGRKRAEDLKKRMLE